MPCSALWTPQGLVVSLSLCIGLSQRRGTPRQREYPPGLEPDPPGPALLDASSQEAAPPGQGLDALPAAGGTPWIPGPNPHDCQLFTHKGFYLPEIPAFHKDSSSSPVNEEGCFRVRAIP